MCGLLVGSVLLLFYGCVEDVLCLVWVSCMFSGIGD